MQHNFTRRNWSWEYFYYDGSKYLQDRSHRNAWCKGCLRSRSRALKQKDETLVLSGQIKVIRSDEEHFAEALSETGPICGKVRKLHTHLARCEHVDRKTCHRAAADQASPRHRGPSSALVSGPEDPMPKPPVGQQTWFETALCRTAVSAGWSWNSVNDPEFVSMMKILRPDLTIPDRRKLSEQILNQEVDRVVQDLKQQVEGHIATGICDGWKNVSKTSVIASMITVDYQAHITHVHDISASRKTADNLLKLVLEEIEYIQKELSITLAAYCTDASGECRAMRNQLYSLMPHLITLDCYAHQVNLIVGNLFKHDKGLAAVAEKASKVIKWFRNHSFALGLLRKCQAAEFGTVLALISAVPTRWTAHYCAAARLLGIAKALVICVVRHEAALVESSRTTNSEGQKTAREVFEIVKDTQFWQQLLQMKILLQPLAIAANVTQAADTRLDHVLVTFGNLYGIFSRGKMSEEACTIALQSLEKRWGKADQHPFIAAVYFNPFYRHHLFNSDEPALAPLGLYTMLKRLFTRLFPREELQVGEFFSANEAYAAGKGVFSDKEMCLQEIEEQSNSNSTQITLARIWGHLASGRKSGVRQFAQLAQHILSIVPNSAGCERLFSQMGIAHTKLRNRLALSSTRKIVQLKLDLRARHLREGLIRPRALQRYGRNTALSGQEHEYTSGEDGSEDDTEEDIEYEADTRNVIENLVADVDGDEDTGTGSDGEDMDCGDDGEPEPEHTGTRPLPRIIFRWTHELTLARLFDYAAASRNEGRWQRARRIWAGGMSNLESEMRAYGLDEVIGEKDVEMNNPD